MRVCGVLVLDGASRPKACAMPSVWGGNSATDCAFFRPHGETVKHDWSLVARYAGAGAVRACAVFDHARCAADLGGSAVNAAS